MEATAKLRLLQVLVRTAVTRGRDALSHRLGLAAGAGDQYEEALNDAYVRRACATLGITRRELGEVIELEYRGAKRRVHGEWFDIDSYATGKLASDKPTCSRLMREAGLPVPDFAAVEAGDVGGAIAACARWPGKVVLKPAVGTGGGQGVTAGIVHDDRRAIRAALWKASAYSRSVMVERFIEGENYRFLVCMGELLSVVRRVPASVVGDGSATLRELIDRESERRLAKLKRLPALEHPMLNPIQVDASLLKENGHSMSSVVEKGARVQCLRVCNRTPGGETFDITSEVHPEFQDVAVRAAEAVGINLAGLDVICTGVDRPLAASGAAINEINTTPGLTAHYEVTNTEAQKDVLAVLLRRMFPALASASQSVASQAPPT
ncbi:MAG: hypothetical protein IT371_07825 [Deltaproteobacteria bacterium]|nr:hypothetical protein [Deltaproteobacteria bacterium]